MILFYAAHNASYNDLIWLFLHKKTLVLNNIDRFYQNTYYKAISTDAFIRNAINNDFYLRLSNASEKNNLLKSEEYKIILSFTLGLDEALLESLSYIIPNFLWSENFIQLFKYKESLYMTNCDNINNLQEKHNITANYIHAHTINIIGKKIIQSYAFFT
jgi:hypothetical protein